MIGVISDDLTGAAELGAVGLRYGMAAEIVAAGEPSGNADLVCVDTSSRSSPPEEAADRRGGVGRGGPAVRNGGGNRRGRGTERQRGPGLRGHEFPFMRAGGSSAQ